MKIMTAALMRSSSFQFSAGQRTVRASVKLRTAYEVT